ncbi:Hypothetical predicted protein [Mytilus galloprovincialis]|uniref:Uncharacterized protein n=1 Tax=Mytilus galloprovincialis TaxID=29158 RepID=A0A8B6G8U5_MYTGA|nr:Hypothetical predicted protein [Mytilus galloprovincialis]
MASCVRPGRIFMSRFLNWLRSAQKDILWWVNFLPHYNGISMMMLEEWSKPDEVYSSDSFLSACGGWFSGKFFHQVLKLWAQCFRGKRIRILCDNITYVTVINTELELIQLKEDVKVSTRAAYALGSKKNLLVQWRAFFTILHVL